MNEQVSIDQIDWRALTGSSVFQSEITQLKNQHSDTLYIKRVRFSKNPKSTIYFFHDVLDHHDRYAKSMIEYFKQHGFQDELVFMDYPGHGLSSGTRGHLNSIDDLVENLILVLTKIPHAGSFYFWGHGLGALLGLHFCLYGKALVYQDLMKNFKGMIASNFYFEFSERLNPMIKLLEVVERNDALSVSHVKLNRLVWGKDQSYQKNVQEHYEADPLNIHRMSYQAYRTIEGLAAKISQKAYFIDFPVLFLVGKSDPLINLEKTQLFVKSIEKKYYKLIELPDSKHDLYNDTDSSFVFKEILNWVNK
ncbi:MAG: lysophospholipase [Bacteriovoracaceae bacterium]|nr:lysophospholipase [Bacteriovoracaceae bacterium]